MRTVRWLPVAALLLFLTPGVLQAQASDDPAFRFRARLAATPIGTELSVTLEDGTHFEGPLAEVGEESFGVWVEPDEDMKERLGLTSPKLNQKIRYDELADLSGAREPAISSEELRFRMRVGDSIRVSASDGSETRGELEAFDGDLLQVDERSFRLSNGDVQRIELKDDDSLKNGALIGLGIGVGWVALACAVPEANCDAGGAVIAGLIMGGGLAGLGALIDAARTRSEVVYVSPKAPPNRVSFAPFLTRDAKGLLVRISF